MEIGLIVHTLLRNAKGEILLLRRSKINDVMPGVWDFPGGTLEEGENPADGAVREVYEETGMHILHPELLTYHVQTDAAKNKRFLTLIFLGRVASAPVTLNPDEHDDFHWVLPSAVNTLPCVPYVSKSVDVLLKRK